MKSPQGHVLYLGIVALAFFRWEDRPEEAVPDAVRLLEDPFVEVLEVGTLPDSRIEAQLGEVIRSGHVRRVFSPSGALGAQSSALWANEPSARRGGLEEARALVDKAIALGSGVLALAPGRIPDDLSKRPGAMRQLAKNLLELASYADDRSGGKLFLAIETMDSDIHRRQILSKTGEAAEFVLDLRASAPHLGLLLDLSHIPMVGESIEEAVSAAGPALVHTHAGNCILKAGHPLYGDCHPPFGAPSSEIGVAELARYIGALMKSPYFAAGDAPRSDLPFGYPSLSLEVITHSGECPFEAIDSAKHVFLTALGEG